MNPLLKWLAVFGVSLAASSSLVLGQPNPVLERGVKLFSDREYAVEDVPSTVRGLPFLRGSIERPEVVVTKPGTLYALTAPSTRPSSQENTLKRLGFEKSDAPEVRLFDAEPQVNLYRKTVHAGERLILRKMVVFAPAEGAEARLIDPFAPVDAHTEPPVILENPGAEFQDDARPGAMIIGMDRTPRGRIWGCWTGTGDKQDGYFLLATSDDDGTSWSKPRLAVGAPDPTDKRQRGALVGNLWTDPEGRLWLFFDQFVVGGTGLRANWFIRCDNPDAETPVWSEPVQFANGCTLNKPTVLKNGDWLLPMSQWEEKTAWLYASSDRGQTWKPRGSVKFPGWEFDEHMTVELHDGRLWMLARTKGQPHESFSSDGGATWTEPRQAATVQNVNARFFVRRLKSGRILLVKNGPPTERLDRRTHLSAWLSEDEGQTWKGGLLLDERNAVSYPDGFEAPDGLIHILYDWNRHTDAEILLAKFREEDILAGKIVSNGANLQMLANKATGPKPTLYNGIELPSEWPPRRLDPRSTEPMPVPYLKHVPKTIPIDVGRQLFVDDFLIERTDLKRTFHHPTKSEGNPVLKAETARELAPSGAGEAGQEATVFTGHGGVFFDPSEKRFKLFYTAGWRGPLAMATSTDMQHWSRPNLGLAGDNVLLPEGIRWSGSELKTSGSDNCVWLDWNAKKPAECLKYLTCWEHAPAQFRPQGFSHSLHVSNGQTWSPARPTGLAQDYCSFFYNPFRDLWIFSIKQGNARGRCRYYSESRDFLAGADYSKSVYWTNADQLDAPEPEGGYPGAGEPTQLYSLNAVAYESVLVGIHSILRGPKNEICDANKFPKLIDLEVGFSRDGFHWDRPDRTGFIRASRSEASWDRGYLHTTAGVFVVLEDRLVFPYNGFSGISPSGKHGMYTGGSIGIATLRRDGFASMDAVESTGTLTTRPIKFKGKHLFVNAEAPHGSLRVEVLDDAGNIIPPFSAENCLPVSGNKTRTQVTWRGADNLGAVSGKRVRFRFTLTDGSLYSFWVTPDPNGASYGYVGSGGPAFEGTQDIPHKHNP
jgi:predicted neuraminidase